MIAAVRGDTAASTASVSIRYVPSTQSTSTGVAPARETASAVAMNVLAGRMHSSSCPMPSPRGSGDFERVSAVRRPYAMRHADELGVLALECGHLGAADERSLGQDIPPAFRDLIGHDRMLGHEVDELESRSRSSPFMMCGNAQNTDDTKRTVSTLEQLVARNADGTIRPEPLRCVEPERSSVIAKFQHHLEEAVRPKGARCSDSPSSPGPPTRMCRACGMKVTEVLIGGAGGLARETAAAVRACIASGAHFEVVGFLDDDADLVGRVIDGSPVVGPFEPVAAMTGLTWFWPRDARTTTAAATRSVERCALPRSRYVTVLHPGAQLGDTVTVGVGTIVLAAVVAPRHRWRSGATSCSCRRWSSRMTTSSATSRPLPQESRSAAASTSARAPTSGRVPASARGCRSGPGPWWLARS